MKNGELKKRVLRAAQDNHIWVNAFTLIRPTKETYEGIGKAVVEMLTPKENLLPSYHGGKDDSDVGEIQTLTKMLYMSINAS